MTPRRLVLNRELPFVNAVMSLTGDQGLDPALRALDEAERECGVICLYRDGADWPDGLFAPKRARRRCL